MQKSKINLKKLSEMVDEGKSKDEIAQTFGVSLQAVWKACRSIGKAVSTHVAVRKAPDVVKKSFNTIDQLIKINEYANELLDLVMRWNRGEDVALQILEQQVKMVKVGTGKDVEWIKEYRFKDPRELALKAMGEIREQLKLQLEMYKTLYDLQANAEFQQEIIQLLGEIDPNVRDEFLRRLEKKRLVRNALRSGDHKI